MTTGTKRIAINAGGGYVPDLNAAVTGTVLAEGAKPKTSSEPAPTASAGAQVSTQHIRAVLAFIRPHKNVANYELLPYHRFGEAKYGFLGHIYEMRDFTPPTAETMQRLRAIIDEAFGRNSSAKA